MERKKEMSSKCTAYVFYGYIQPANNGYVWSHQDEEKDGCFVYWYGARYAHSFLAIKRSMTGAHGFNDWFQTIKTMEIQEMWNEQLESAAHYWNIDITKLIPQWFLAIDIEEKK
jgi:hypothetical protein